MLPDFRLETHFSRWEFSARFHLCASDMQTLPMTELVALGSDDAQRAWHELELGYTETYGSPELRIAIAGTYDTLASEHILTFAGAEEGIYAAMNVLLDESDHAIVITPNYQAAETVPMSICQTSGVALDPDDNWNLSLDRLEAAIQPNTKLISINFPHNPTGKVLSRADFDALIALADRHSLYVFSDEVYRLLERDDSRRLPQVADCYERGLSLNVMSKAYGLPGLRIGWIACRDQAVLQRLERAKHYLSICNSAPSELLAMIALSAADQIITRNRKIMDSNLVLLNNFFSMHDDLFEWRVPDGGCIGYPKYLGDDGVEAFCENLVTKAGVLLLPASVYESDLTQTPPNHFRIGFGRHDMADGLKTLENYLQ